MNVSGTTEGHDLCFNTNAGKRLFKLSIAISGIFLSTKDAAYTHEQLQGGR